MALLHRDFYFQNTTTVAKKLLGKILCHKNNRGKIIKGRIVETEAYLGVEDPACHTFGDRRTNRTRSMYLDGGHSYIYFIYGMYHCLNVVTRTSAHPEAVLIRAIEPLPANKKSPSLPQPKEKKLLTNGPGKLCRFLELDKTHDGLELWRKNSGLWIEEAPQIKRSELIKKPRIGVDYAGFAALWPLRFYIRDNPYVSKK